MDSQPKDLAQDIAEIRGYKRQIDDNLAKSEEILALAQSKLNAGLALLKKAADERDKILVERAAVVKLAKGLKVREERLNQREEAITLGVPTAAPYPALKGNY